MILDEIFETEEELLDKYKLSISGYNLVINEKSIPLDVLLTILEQGKFPKDSENFRANPKNSINIQIEYRSFVKILYMGYFWLVKPFKLLQIAEAYNKNKDNQVDKIIIECPDAHIYRKEDSFTEWIFSNDKYVQDVKDEGSNLGSCYVGEDKSEEEGYICIATFEGNVTPPYPLKNEEQLT